LKYLKKTSLLQLYLVSQDLMAVLLVVEKDTRNIGGVDN